MQHEDGEVEQEELARCDGGTDTEVQNDGEEKRDEDQNGHFHEGFGDVVREHIVHFVSLLPQEYWSLLLESEYHCHQRVH